VRITIVGAPVTKKNSGQLVSTGAKCRACGNRTGRPFMLPSPQSKAWTASAVRQMHEQHPDASPAGPIFTIPVNCRALFFRERATGDANNFYAAIADALEAAGVVANDRLIVSWDGSRMLKDAANPRIEILLTPVDDAEYSTLRTWRPRAA
jgi:Holliday junction resolvase RusA-like endonuclease